MNVAVLFLIKDGNILSRRFHKFFNVGEREETLIDKIDLNQPHTILEKLDGSMVTPIINPDTGELFWGTKMGRTDISEDVAEFVEDKPEYKNVCCDVSSFRQNTHFRILCSI